jgi:hypothetical protein
MDALIMRKSSEETVGAPTQYQYWDTESTLPNH